MKTLCSWCGQTIIGGVPDENGLVSHDMCGTCAARMEVDLWIEQIRPSLTTAPVDVLCALAGEPSSGVAHAGEALESAARVELDARRRDQALSAATELLDEDINKLKSKTLVVCDCGAEFEIHEIGYIQTHYYIEPRGCCGGDYWREGEGQWECPECGHRNRLYTRPEVMKLKRLFKKVVDEYKE